MSSRIGFYYDAINADHFFHSCTEDATYIYTAWVSGALAGEEGSYGTILKLAKADLSVAASYKVTERSGGAHISIQRMILSGSYLYVWMLESSSLTVGISQLNVADLTHVATNWYSAVDSANMDALSMCYGTDANASPQNCLYCAGFNIGIGNYFRLLKIKDDLTLPTTYAWKDTTIGWPFQIKADGTDLYVAGKILQYGYIARLAQAAGDTITLDRSTLFTTTDSATFPLNIDTVLIDFVVDGDYIWAVGFIPRTGAVTVNDGVLVRFVKKDAGNGNRISINQAFRITNSSQRSYGCASIGIVGDFIYITTSPWPHTALGDDLDPTSAHETAIIALDKSDAEAGTATIKWARGISNSSGTANSGMMWGLLSSAGDYYGCGWSRIIKDANDNRSAMVYKNDVSDWGTDTTTYYGLNGIVMEENVASDITITSVTLTPTYGTSNTLSSITATPDASEPAWAAASGSYAVNSTNIDLLDEQSIIYIYPVSDVIANQPNVVGTTATVYNGSSHAQAVNDLVGAQDSTGTYIWSQNVNWYRELYSPGWENATLAGYITQVSMHMLARLTVTANATFLKLCYTTGGSTSVFQDSTMKALSTAAFENQTLLEWDITSAHTPWQWSDLNTLNFWFGSYARANIANQLQITQQYVKVVWAPYVTLNQTMIYCETAISAISLTQAQSLGMTNVACLCQMTSPLTLSMGWALVPGNPICLTQLTSPITLSMGWGLVPGNITCLTQITSPLTLTMCFALVPGSPTCLTQLTSPLNLTQRQVLGMTSITCLTEYGPAVITVQRKLGMSNIACLTNYGPAVITVQRVLGLNSLACTTKISDISLSNKLTLSVPSIIIPCAISLTSINLNAGLTLSITSLACETNFGIPIFAGERAWLGEREWEYEILYLIQNHYLAIGSIACLTTISGITLETAGAITLTNSNITCLTNLSLTSLKQNHSLGMTSIACLTNISSISLTLHQHLNLSITSIQCSALVTSLSLQQKIQIGIPAVVCSTYITPLVVSRLTNLTVGSMTCLTSISTIILNQIHNLELVSIGCDVNITGINLTLVTPGFDILTISNLNCDTFISSIDFTQDFMLIPESPTCLCSISIPDILVAHTLTLSSIGCTSLISPINLSLSYLMTVDDINCSTTISIINLSVSIADYGLTVASVICPTTVTSIELSLAQNLLLNSIACLCHITSIAFPMLGPIRRPSISSITRSRTIKRRM